MRAEIKACPSCGRFMADPKRHEKYCLARLPQQAEQDLREYRRPVRLALTRQQQYRAGMSDRWGGTGW